MHRTMEEVEMTRLKLVVTVATVLSAVTATGAAGQSVAAVGPAPVSLVATITSTPAELAKLLTRSVSVVATTDLRLAHLPATLVERGGPSYRTAPPESWVMGDDADSLYRAAREALNRGEYRRAAQLFRELGERYPRSAYASDAQYWQAFALYRLGGTAELREAIRLLETHQSRGGGDASRAEVAALTARVRGDLARRGDERARTQVTIDAARTSTCDKEDMAVRLEALNALSQMDPDGVKPLLRRVLSRRDQCAATLRRRAIFLVSRNADAEAIDLLSDVARSDDDATVRAEAVQWLGRISGDHSAVALEDVVRGANDEKVQRAAVRALLAHESPRARRSVRALIENRDAPEPLRAEALGSFSKERSTADDAAYLRAVYGRLESDNLRQRVVGAVAKLGGEQNERWLVDLARDASEPKALRATVLASLGRTSVPIGQLARIYDATPERELREQLVGVFGKRTEAEATDKLFDIVRNESDPRLRRQAISVLTRKNDPRTTRLLQEIIEP